jgi:hypothetical protein
VSGSVDDERTRRLMMARLDGEISDAEARELDRLLAQDDGLRAEWEKLRRVREVTETMKFRTPPEEVWDDYWTGVYNRAERGFGWVLVSLGTTIMLSFVGWNVIQEVLADTTMPGLVKLGLLALTVGGAVLLVSVLREKLFTSRSDPYKEIKR